MYRRRLSNHNVLWKQIIPKFVWKWTNKIHKFETCFPKSQVSSNAFKVFNGCRVEPWMLFIGLFAKIYIYIYTGILRILCFQKTFWFGQSFSKCPSSTVHTVMCSGELFPKWCMLATLVTRSFSTTTLKFWNSPPVHICDIQSLAAFKRLVKTFF